MIHPSFSCQPCLLCEAPLRYLTAFSVSGGLDYPTPRDSSIEASEPSAAEEIDELARQIQWLRQYLRSKGITSNQLLNGQLDNSEDGDKDEQGLEDRVMSNNLVDMDPPAAAFERRIRAGSRRPWKRGPGSCINSCLGSAMSFVRCKSMCH